MACCYSFFDCRYDYYFTPTKSNNIILYAKSTLNNNAWITYRTWVTSACKCDGKMIKGVRDLNEQHELHRSQVQMYALGFIGGRNGIFLFTLKWQQPINQKKLCQEKLITELNCLGFSKMLFYFKFLGKMNERKKNHGQYMCAAYGFQSAIILMVVQKQSKSVPIKPTLRLEQLQQAIV